MKNNLLSQNSKMKESSTNEIKILNWSLPAVKTCPFAGECKKFCYASKGFYRFKGVANKHASNYSVTLTDAFIPLMSHEIAHYKSKVKKLMVRIHDTGDFYSVEYLEKWLKIIELHKDVDFYAYTKSIPFFKGRQLPDNFRVIYSFGGLKDNMINKESDRHAVVVKEVTADYVDGSNDDKVAGLGTSKKIALIIH
jgi:hypothetical protein